MDRILIVAILILFAPTASIGAPIRIVTYNVLYDNPTRPWSGRAAAVGKIIDGRSPDIFGLQEALVPMIADIQRWFPEFRWVGVGRDDGKDAGEFTPIFFSERKFELIDSSTFWLSSTPDVPGSRDWGNSYPRIATWALLKTKSNNETILVINTHLDHLSWNSREKGVRLILEKAKALAGDARLIVMGDLNSQKHDFPFRHLSGSGTLRDTEALSSRPPSGPDWSFVSLGGFYRSRIDFIFADPRWRVLSHHISDERVDDELPSDHLPVTVELESGRSEPGPGGFTEIEVRDGPEPK